MQNTSPNFGNYWMRNRIDQRRNNRWDRLISYAIAFAIIALLAIASILKCSGQTTDCPPGGT